MLWTPFLMEVGGRGHCHDGMWYCGGKKVVDVICISNGF